METAFINGVWFANHFLKETNDIKKCIKFVFSKLKMKYNRSITIEKDKRKRSIKKQRVKGSLASEESPKPEKVITQR